MLRALFKSLFSPLGSRPPPAASMAEVEAQIKTRQFGQAQRLCEEILADDADDATAWLCLGRIHVKQNNFSAAKTAADKAIVLSPSMAAAYFLRGNVRRAMNAMKPALRDYAKALELDPTMIAAHMKQVSVHYKLGAFEQALECAQRALELDPENIDAQYNQGLMLREVGDAAAAETVLSLAVARDPGHHATRCALALVLIDRGDFSAAEQHLAAVLGADPLHNEARWLSCIADLARGRFREGWRRYDSRLQREDAWRRPYTYPAWDGQALPGSLLIYAEQGLGDDILFASCINDVLPRAEHCVIECELRLVELFRRSFPAATVHGSKHEAEPQWLLGNHDISAQIAAGSLPGLLRNEAEDFPQHQGYLQADAAKTAHWQARLAQLGPGLKVGLAWTGGALKTRRRIRSVSLIDLLPILSIPELHFISLQYVDSAAEIEQLRVQCGRQVHHWPDALDDYDETAALVNALDLVISVCTSVVHLTGALGKPVWVMAPTSAEWRYLRAGEQLPWYPSARVFRQTQRGAWGPLIGQIAAELQTPARRHIQPT